MLHDRRLNVLFLKIDMPLKQGYSREVSSKSYSLQLTKNCTKNDQVKENRLNFALDLLSGLWSTVCQIDQALVTDIHRIQEFNSDYQNESKHNKNEADNKN